MYNINTKIHEIADRMWRVHPRDIDAMGLKTRIEYYEKELRDFAELLVKECARVDSEENNIDHVDGETFNQTILRHFGINE